MPVDVRKKQRPTLPAAARAAIRTIKQERGCSLDPLKERVGYGRKPQFPLEHVVQTFEDQWLEGKIRKIYTDLKPKITGYTELVKAIVREFNIKFKGVDNGD